LTLAPAASMEKIKLHIQPYRLDFAVPFRTARGVQRQREGWLVRAEDNRGSHGWGEAAPLPGFGTEDMKAAEKALAGLKSYVERAVPPESPSGVDLLLSRALHGSPPVPAARHGVETALLDLLAVRTAVPLARLFHDKPAEEVECNATLGLLSPEQAARAAAGAVAAGYKTIKLKAGTDDPRTDLTRLSMVRESVGRGVRLRVDANGSWSPEQALERLVSWQELGLEYVEQPLARGREEELLELARSSCVPLAADESASDPQSVARLLNGDKPSIAVLVLKPMALGGLWPTWELAEKARQRGVDVVVTTMLEGAVGRMAALHLAAAIQGGLPVERRRACGLATGQMLAQDHPPGDRVLPLPDAPRMKLPTEGGLGFQPAFKRPANSSL